MRSIDDTELARINAGEYAHAELLLLDLVEGQFGFWGGNVPIEVNGINYVGCGSLLDIEGIAAGTDLSAAPLTVRLRAVPEHGLTPDVLATIEQYGYKGRPATLYYAWINKATGTIALVQPIWRGYIDKVEHDETVGGAYVLVGALEPRSLDHSRTGHRTRSDADQRAMDPDDLFFEHAATVNTEQIYYGRAAPGQVFPHSWLPGANRP